MSSSMALFAHSIPAARFQSDADFLNFASICRTEGKDSWCVVNLYSNNGEKVVSQPIRANMIILCNMQLSCRKCSCACSCSSRRMNFYR